MTSNTARQIANRIAQLRAIQAGRQQEPPDPGRQHFGPAPRKKAKPARRKKGRK